MDNLETSATINDGQSRDIGNIGNKTQDEDKEKTTQKTKKMSNTCTQKTKKMSNTCTQKT
jgi:hypothetical protein